MGGGAAGSGSSCVCPRAVHGRASCTALPRASCRPPETGNQLFGTTAPESTLNPVVICLCRRWGGPAPSLRAPISPAVDRLAFFCKFAESAANRDHPPLTDEILPRFIGLNIEHQRRKLDRVNQPILFRQDIQNAALNNAGASAHDKCSDLRTMVKS